MNLSERGLFPNILDFEFGVGVKMVGSLSFAEGKVVRIFGGSGDWSHLTMFNSLIRENSFKGWRIGGAGYFEERGGRVELKISSSTLSSRGILSAKDNEVWFTNNLPNWTNKDVIELFL